MSTQTGPAPAAAPSELYTQTLRWSPRPPGGDSPDGEPVLEQPVLEQAVLEVPRDWRDPDGERLTVAVGRLRAADPARRRGVLIAVNGGPGGDWGEGVGMPARFAGTPVHQVYDVIGIDPRGTGDSTPLYAEVVPPGVPFDSRPADEAFPAIAEDMRLREEGCQRGGGALRPYISTRNIARDMDLLRATLGEERISFVGYAYGAYLGAVYGSLFPDRLDRSVLDSSVNPEWTWREQFLWQGDAVRRSVEAWAAWTAQRDGGFGLGTTGEEVLGSVEDTVAAVEKATGGPGERTLFDGAVGTRSVDRAQWAELARLTGQLRAAAAEGDGETIRGLLATQSVWRPGDSAGELRIGVLEAITLEHEWPVDLEVYYRDMREFRRRFPYGYGVLRAQPWVGAFRTFQPLEPPVPIVRSGYPVGLVVQAEGDPMDHYEGGVAMARLLGHRLVTIADSGEHEVYVLGGNPAVDEPVHRYLTDGELPPEEGLTVPGKAPRPDVPADAGTDPA